jgi:outer membrane protein insertion porin family
VKSVFVATVLLFASVAFASAQQGQCQVVDSVTIDGARRLDDRTILRRAGIVAGEQICRTDIQRAIESIYSTGQVSDVRVYQSRVDGRQLLLFEVNERPMLARWEVQGTENLSARSVRGRVRLLEGRPFDPAAAARSRAAIDSLYKEEGYYFSSIDLRVEPRDDGGVVAVFEVDEGRRIALSQVIVDGNDEFDDGAVVGEMATGPEGFWWWKSGEYNDDTVDRDIRQRLPDHYGSRGFIDFRVLRDTLVVHEETGKGTLLLDIDEGEQYTVGTFDIVGNRHFSTEQLETVYPFGRRQTGFLGLGGVRTGPATFDQGAWQNATDQLNQLYSNNGYIYARITPQVIRRAGDDTTHTVDLRWDIAEGAPAIVNKVMIRGNNVTHENVIRRAISVVPGDVFRQDALIQSYQSISNLGFFEQPLPVPETEQANQQGDIDIIFNVQERHTGSVQFGASVGQGVGVGGFVGFQDPNMFGRGKQVNVNWQFGRRINDLRLSYTDPALRGSLISGTVSLHSSRLRYTVADLGRINTRGGSLQFGFPLFGSRFTRILTTYSLEQSEYDSPTLSTRYFCKNCILSSIGLSLVRDTRIGLPFATGGTLHQLSMTQNGGPLGGTGNFRRATFEGRWYAPLGQLGGSADLGSQGIQFLLGLTAKSGFVWGDVGPHFRQLFSMGGTQFGIPLRGYDEFSVTPFGFDARASGYFANTVDAFGGSYQVFTGEIGARISQALYFSTFFDAGNVWRTPAEFNPTQLFRGVGVGVSLLSPLGPIGIDYAYGFDRRDLNGNRDPGWKFHFKLGMIQ